MLDIANGFLFIPYVVVSLISFFVLDFNKQLRPLDPFFNPAGYLELSHDKPQSSIDKQENILIIIITAPVLRISIKVF